MSSPARTAVFFVYASAINILNYQLFQTTRLCSDTFCMICLICKISTIKKNENIKVSVYLAFLACECEHTVPQKPIMLLLCSRDVPRLHLFTSIPTYYTYWWTNWRGKIKVSIFSSLYIKHVKAAVVPTSPDLLCAHTLSAGHKIENNVFSFLPVEYPLLLSW